MLIMSNDLVSIIMLSKDNGKYVEETVRSVMAQTCQNWEIIFMDDSSKDDTISKMMDLMNESRVKKSDGMFESRIKVSQSVQSRGYGVSLNSALSDVRGRWVAFLNVGDIWEPEKLTKQIAFMEKNRYAFSYTKFGLMNKKSQDRGVVIGGKDYITYKDMQKCCWPSYLTVMYDRKKVGEMRVEMYSLTTTVANERSGHLPIYGRA